VTLSETLAQIETVFFDTARIIYYIEAHPRFGPLAKEAVQAFQDGPQVAYSSVITLAEVLAKPVQLGKIALRDDLLIFYSPGEIFICWRSMSRSQIERVGYVASTQL
jgi:hypothetical protein